MDRRENGGRQSGRLAVDRLRLGSALPVIEGRWDFTERERTADRFTTIARPIVVFKFPRGGRGAYQSTCVRTRKVFGCAPL